MHGAFFFFQTHNPPPNAHDISPTSQNEMIDGCALAEMQSLDAQSTSNELQRQIQNTGHAEL